MNLRNLIFLHAFLLPVFGQRLKIGAVFDKKDSLEERIFKFAIASMNNELKRFNMSLVSLVRYASTMSAFENINAANQLISDGVISIIGPRTSTAVKAMHSLCMKYHIPQLSPSATDPDFMFRFFRYSFLLRMSPGDTLMSLALKDLISHFKWERVGILTSRTDYAMNSLMDFRVFANQAGLKILAIEHFSVTQDASQVNATKELLNLRQKGARVIILNCIDSYTPVVLTQAGKLEMIKDWVWILTDAAIAKEEGLYNYTEGLVGVRLPTRGSGEVFEKVSREWRDIGETGHINARAGRTFDAVLTISHALQQMAADNITIIEPSLGNGLCPRTPGDQPWSLGITFLRFLKRVKTKGIMSDITFRLTGSPRKTIYDIVNYQSDEGWVKVGDWNDDNYPPLRMERKRPIVWLDGELAVPKLASLDLRYAKLKVLVALLYRIACSFVSPVVYRYMRTEPKNSRPFVMIKSKLSPGDDDLGYEGFCIDLLKKLHEKLQFAYDIQLKDKFGEKQPQGTWDGIIGELSREKADLGVSTFTISPEKEKAVDFTQPYFSVSFKIITKKTHRESKANIWGFLSPFERTLWIAIIVASAVVGTVVWIYDRLSPYGYYGRTVQSADVTQDDIHAKNTLNLINSFWSAVASYLEQGPEQFYPISYSGRALILTWWFAIAIFGATYTANLAAFLTINKYEQPIKSIEDLANQDRIAYGTAPGSLSEMLKSSSLPAYQRLWRYISSHGTLEANDSFGFDKARRTEDYAFLWESATVDYEVQSKPCNTLKVIGRPFGSINYGFALPRNSPYTHNFSVAMLELQQEGFMERMTEKWFRSRSVCGAETVAATKSEEEGGHQLEFSDMAGVFITLAVVVASGIAVLLIELIYASYKDTMDKHSQPPMSFSQAFSERLRRSCCGEKSIFTRMRRPVKTIKTMI